MSQSTVPHGCRISFAVAVQILNRAINFLVDTGADVSLLPSSFKSKAFPFQIHLTAANGSSIKTYGCLTAKVTFPALRREFDVKFIVADVTDAILGADFFKIHHLLIDVANKLLVDRTTKLSISLVRRNALMPAINAISNVKDDILAVLHKNAAVFDIQAPRPKPNTEFSIITTAVPKPARPYRLSPEKLRAAKDEVSKEMAQGRMIRSSSQYASAFFPVKKPDGGWRFVADYAPLNNVTVKDNYLPPRIDDLRAFPKIAYSQKWISKRHFFRFQSERMINQKQQWPHPLACLSTK